MKQTNELNGDLNLQSELYHDRSNLFVDVTLSNDLITLLGVAWLEDFGSFH